LVDRARSTLKGLAAMRLTGKKDDPSARERILVAAAELFAESGFDATPTSRIAALAKVPKGLVHYYFQKKQDLLTALVDRLPDTRVEPKRVVVPGDVAASLRRLVAELDARNRASTLLSHPLWREADTHPSVKEALEARFENVVDQVKAVIQAASTGTLSLADVDTAAGLLALAVSYRHSIARHADTDETMDREVNFIAKALTAARRQPVNPRG
jgi:AcrR family transcriptional regulator